MLAELLGEEEKEWASHSAKRIELIRKSNRETLSSEEATELQGLQDAADKRLEQRDLELLSQLEQFRTEVEGLPARSHK